MSKIVDIVYTSNFLLNKTMFSRSTPLPLSGEYSTYLTFMGPCIVRIFYYIIQQDAMLHSLSGNCSKRFGWYHHPSSGAQTAVSTAPGIFHTVTATPPTTHSDQFRLFHDSGR